jgi:hypothetical protein
VSDRTCCSKLRTWVEAPGFRLGPIHIGFRMSDGGLTKYRHSKVVLRDTANRRLATVPQAVPCLSVLEGIWKDLQGNLRSVSKTGAQAAGLSGPYCQLYCQQDPASCRIDRSGTLQIAPSDEESPVRCRESGSSGYA